MAGRGTAPGAAHTRRRSPPAPLAWPLVSAAEMRELDRYTIEDLAVAGDALMESAGRAVAQVALESWHERGGEVVIVCGGGNNGGDGFVIARHLRALRVPVRIALLADRERLRGAAAVNLERAQRLGFELEGERWRVPRSGVIVDAIFGTGLARPVTGAAATAVRRIAKARGAGCAVIAVDLPSGLDSDSGQALGACVEADVTVTLGLPKLGLALEPGRSLAGRVLVARIGIADETPQTRPTAEVWTRAVAGALLPERPRAGHKGSFGHVLVIAGSEGKTGAAALAAIAAGRSGAGLVTVACPASLCDVLEQKCTEAMTAAVAETSERALAQAAAAELARLAGERDVVALGPGIGRSDETQKLVRSLVAQIERPLVLDADGLFPFAADRDPLRQRRAPTVLTPHPGEAAHLLGTTAARVNADRLAAARELSSRFDAVTLLKGAATVVATPDGRAIVNPTGGPELSTGGSGDVLTGVVAAYLAQGLEPALAAAAAAYVHGACGDALARGHGRSGMLAGDLAQTLPSVMHALRRDAEGGKERDGDAVHTRSGPTAGLLVSFPEP